MIFSARAALDAMPTQKNPHLWKGTNYPIEKIMNLPSEGQLLRIFVGESDRYQGKPLYEWIVLKAREEGLAGATVLRGIMGFGANSRIHTAKILRLSEGVPVVIEIVDEGANLEKFLELIDPAIGEGLATLEKARIQFYRSTGHKKP